VGLDGLGDLERGLVGADDEHRAVVEAAEADVARGEADRQLLGEQEEAGEDGEEQDPEAADAVAEEPLVEAADVEAQGEERGAEDADANDGEGLVEEGDGAVRAVAARGEEEDAPDGQGQGEEG
jgi:hypothetical protein